MLYLHCIDIKKIYNYNQSKILFKIDDLRI